MKKSSKTEAELKKGVACKKACSVPLKSKRRLISFFFFWKKRIFSQMHYAFENIPKQDDLHWLWGSMKLNYEKRVRNSDPEQKT